MDPKFVPLLYLCSLCGVVMVVGGMLLIYKEKIYIDRESKQVTEIETPIGKFKTNVPALVLFVLGFVPLTYPLLKVRELRQTFSINGKVLSEAFPVTVYAVAASQSDFLNGARSFTLEVPATADNYKIIYYAGGRFAGEEQVSAKAAKNGMIQMESKKLDTAPPPQVVPKISSVDNDKF